MVIGLLIHTSTAERGRLALNQMAKKPAASIFHKALKLADVKPEEALHIGDSLAADIAGANDMGILSVWVNPKGADNQTDIEPDYEVKDTVELKEILKTLAQ